MAISLLVLLIILRHQQNVLAMPDGKTHTKIELIAAVLIFPAIFFPVYYFGNIYIKFVEAICFCSGYLLATLLLSPDMDLFKSDSINRWGLLKYIWAPYSWMYNHRGFSHSWLVGTLTRFTYLLLLLSPAVYFYHSEVSQHWPKILFVFAGCWFSNALHLIADRHWKF